MSDQHTGKKGLKMFGKTPLRIGINGFGRIGRMVLRAFLENKDSYKNIQIVCINDISNKDMNIHLLKYDSVHGRAPFDVESTENGMKAGGFEIDVVSVSDPAQIPWADYKVDVVFECSGIFSKKEMAQKHLGETVKQVIVSAPSEGAELTVVYGINHQEITKDHQVISNGSCTTNCISPIVYALDKAFGIEKGYMTTIHSYTGDQRLLDSMHKDERRARAAAISMIPSSTGAAKSVALILPHLKGKLDGASIRVPTPNVSVVDFKCLLSKNVSKEDINSLMKTYSEGELKGILGYTEEQLVSIDYNHTTESSYFDATGTTIIDGNFCRVLSWYDNEFGFSNRMLDVASYISSKNILR